MHELAGLLASDATELRKLSSEAAAAKDYAVKKAAMAAEPDENACCGSIQAINPLVSNDTKLRTKASERAPHRFSYRAPCQLPYRALRRRSFLPSAPLASFTSQR